MSKSYKKKKNKKWESFQYKAKKEMRESKKKGKKKEYFHWINFNDDDDLKYTDRE